MKKIVKKRLKKNEFPSYYRSAYRLFVDGEQYGYAYCDYHSNFVTQTSSPEFTPGLRAWSSRNLKDVIAHAEAVLNDVSVNETHPDLIERDQFISHLRTRLASVGATPAHASRLRWMEWLELSIEFIKQNGSWRINDRLKRTNARVWSYGTAEAPRMSVESQSFKKRRRRFADDASCAQAMFRTNLHEIGHAYTGAEKRWNDPSNSYSIKELEAEVFAITAYVMLVGYDAEDLTLEKSFSYIRGWWPRGGKNKVDWTFLFDQCDRFCEAFSALVEDYVAI